MVMLLLVIYKLTGELGEMENDIVKHSPQFCVSFLLIKQHNNVIGTV